MGATPHFTRGRFMPGYIRPMLFHARSIVFIGLGLVFFGMGCTDHRQTGQEESRILSQEESRLHVAVTVLPEKWLVERIGGDCVTCQVLVSQQQDPHTFQGTDADAARLARCKVFFTVGLPIEQAPWAQAVLKSRQIKVVSLTGEGQFTNGASSTNDANFPDHGIGQRGATSQAESSVDPALVQPGSDSSQGVVWPPSGEREHEHLGVAVARPGTMEQQGDRRKESHQEAVPHEHEEGMHIWLSPRRLMRQAEIVAATLAELDPANAVQYRANLAVVKAELERLDAELRDKLQPLQGERFFVFHPAWECFAEDYGLVQEAVEIQGQEPSDKEMTEIQRRARRSRIKVILVQRTRPSRAALAVAETAGLRPVMVDPLAEDIPSELRRVTQTLVSAYLEGRGGETR